MKVLVTGHRGFIGKNILSYLGCKHDTITLVGDVNDSASSVSVKAVDAVVHLAGKNRGAESSILYTNIVGTLNVATMAALEKKHLVYVGSRYDKKNHYKASKDTAAFMVKSMAENMGFPVTTIKLPQVFGPNCKPFYNSFATTLIYCIAKKQPYEHLIRDENDVFSLVYVDDVCKAILGALEHPPKKHYEWSMAGKGIVLRDLISVIHGRKNLHPLYEQIQQTVEWYRNNESP